MMEDDTREKLEDEYGMPVTRLMYHLYHEEGMSTSQMAEELGRPRETVRYWLQNSGVKMDSRTLTDVQRLLIIIYLSMGVGSGSTAQKVKCGKMSVHRYKKDLEVEGRPVDLKLDLETKDHEILSDIIADGIAPRSREYGESTSDCRADSD